MQELKPCPFCGSEAVTLVDYDRLGGDDIIISAYVKCSNCCVYKRCATNIRNATFEKVETLFNTTISLWNTRVGEQNE